MELYYKENVKKYEELYKEAKAVSNNYTRDSSELKVRRKQK